MTELHRKSVKHVHEPGDVHELTFSCYRQMPLLTCDAWRTCLARSLDEAGDACSLKLIAFAFMPEHVHLLLMAGEVEPSISNYLAAIKRPVSVLANADLTRKRSPLLKRLTIRTRPGVVGFRFWQEGSGYDRNLKSVRAVLAAIDYAHRNPVERKLCTKASAWRWSSARWFESEGTIIDDALPQLRRLPADWLL